jgi:hypothetical protein
MSSSVHVRTIATGRSLDVRVHPGERELNRGDVAPRPRLQQRNPCAWHRVRPLQRCIERGEVEAGEVHVEPRDESWPVEGPRLQRVGDCSRHLEVELVEPGDAVALRERGPERTHAHDHGGDRGRLLRGRE